MCSPGGITAAPFGPTTLLRRYNSVSPGSLARSRASCACPSSLSSQRAAIPPRPRSQCSLRRPSRRRRVPRRSTGHGAAWQRTLGCYLRPSRVAASGSRGGGRSRSSGTDHATPPEDALEAAPSRGLFRRVSAQRIVRRRPGGHCGRVGALGPARRATGPRRAGISAARQASKDVRARGIQLGPAASHAPRAGAELRK